MVFFKLASTVLILINTAHVIEKVDVSLEIIPTHYGCTVCVQKTTSKAKGPFIWETEVLLHYDAWLVIVVGYIHIIILIFT